MKCSPLYSMLMTVVICAAALLVAAAKVGAPAPDFTATASNGKSFRLYDYRGKYVVLEWHNNGCPYVGKHYNSGNMQRLQKQWTARGVVWFTIISSAPGKQGYVTASEENEYLAKMQATPATTNESISAGPVVSWATLPTRTKMPVPMIAPIPKALNATGPSTRLRRWPPSNSCDRLSRDLVANNGFLAM